MIKNLQIFSFIFLILFGYLRTSIKAQTKWYKYPGNPVFSVVEPGERDPPLFGFSVLKEDSLFKMWYTNGHLGDPGSMTLNLATSYDGINWKKFEQNPLDFISDSSFWGTNLSIFDVLKNDSLYFMTFASQSNNSNRTFQLGVAWSKDGITWSKHPQPILKPGNRKWEAGIGGQSVVFDRQRYHVWYNGVSDGILKPCQVGYAYSDNGIDWEKHHGNPVLRLGEEGSWDDQWVTVSDVILDKSVFHMWYFGWDMIQFEIGYASSIDGINWTKSDENPVLTTGNLGEWDASTVFGAYVVKDDSVYRMWYAGTDNHETKIGYATTSITDAIKWEQIKINKPRRKIRVQVLNKQEFIKIDSLIEILGTISGKNLVDACNNLSLAYSLNDEEQSLHYAGKALDLANELNYPKGKALAYYSIGKSRYVMDNYSSALVNQLTALRLFDSLGMMAEKGALLIQIASIHTLTGAHDLALNYQKQAIKVIEQLNDSTNLSLALNQLGNSYLSLEDTASAIKAFRQRVDLSKRTENNRAKGEAFDALGNCYSSKNPDSSLMYYDKATTIWQDLSWPKLANNYLNKAEVFSSKGPDYQKEAEANLENCREIIFFKVLSDQYAQLRLTYRLAEMYFAYGSYKTSGQHLDISHKICLTFLSKHSHQNYTSLYQKLEMDVSLKSYMEKIYRLYYRIDTALNNESSAFRNYILATKWKDSIYNVQNRHQWAMLQGQYETETAQNTIIALEKDNEVKNLRIKQSRTYLLILGGFVIVLILMGLMFLHQNKMKAEHNNVLLEQKLLRSQMNPHFVFNALANIQDFIWKKDPLTANEYLSSFSKLVRLILENSRNDFVPLEKEISAIKNYMVLQKLRYKDQFEFNIDIDPEIDTENMSIPPLLVQPYIENSIEHGFKIKEKTGHVNVRFKLQKELIFVEVEDNGIGFQKSAELNKKQTKDHQSLAMTITHERLQMLYKKYKRRIEFSIDDLKDGKGNITGAKVVFGIPFIEK